MNDIDVWGRIDLEPGGAQSVELGTLDLRLKRTASELWVHAGRDASAEPKWTRWAVSPKAEVHLIPAVPDRLAVVSHETPYNLPPRGNARVFVRIPLNVQVVVREAKEPDVVVADVPSLVLSDTWWGKFTEGELAYWISTAARAEITPDLFLRHLAMCPFRLTNESKEPLPIRRFAVRVTHLTLFMSDAHIWTDEVRVRYEGTDEGSEIEFTGHPPEESPSGRELAPPRSSSPKGLRALTFDKLITLTSLGV